MSKVSKSPSGEELKELRSIRNLLILLLLKGGSNSQEIDKAVKMGAGNIRRLFPSLNKGLQVKQTNKEE